MKEWIEYGILFVVGLPVFYIGCKIAWKVFPHFVSLKQAVELNSAQLYLGRLGFSAWWAFVAAVAVCYVVYLGIDPWFVTASAPTTASVPVSVATPPKISVQAEQSPEPAPAPIPAVINTDQANPNEAETDGHTYHADGFVPPPPEDAPSQTDMTTQADKLPSADTPSQTLTKEQVEQMEKEKGYSGNDPIVRARLGLPPKPDQ